MAEPPLPPVNSDAVDAPRAPSPPPVRAESPECDEFDVELEKDSQGLGITIAGTYGFTLILLVANGRSGFCEHGKKLNILN